MDVFDLVAKITLDSSAYDTALANAKSSAESFLGNVQSLFKKIAIGAAVYKSVQAIVGVAREAVEGYAAYEQLVGGVETLFGAGGQTLEEYAESVGKTVDEVTEQYNTLMAAQETVLENASNAYKTAGLSANEYMETVTSFSASLLQSLEGDTVKAAAVADMAIIDMADNANKMGTAMSSIQNAYQGFAKQNYTMLDNLKLGYGGTKSEMERLLADATALSGVTYDISSLSDVYEAIHVIQENMGITGTTAKEASETIQGSLAAMKSAWQNLLVGVADETADFDALIDNFVDSVETAAENLVPRIEQTILGLAKLVEKLGPIIAERVPKIISEILPSLGRAAVTLVISLVNGIIAQLPEIINAGIEIIFALIDGIIEAIPELIPAIVEAVLAIVDKLTDPETLEDLIDAGFRLLGAVIEGLIKAIPTLVMHAPEIVTNLVDALTRLGPDLIEAGKNMVKDIAKGMIGADAMEAIEEAVGVIVEKIKVLFSPFGLYKVITGNYDEGDVAFGGAFVTGMQTAAMTTAAGPVGTVMNMAGLTSSFKEAISGMTVNMDGRQVGKVVTNNQANYAMARG